MKLHQIVRQNPKGVKVEMKTKAAKKKRADDSKESEPAGGLVDVAPAAAPADLLDTF